MKLLRVLILVGILTQSLYISINAQTVVGNQQVIQVPTTSYGTLTKGLLFLPDDYASTSTKHPLIIFLHGLGEAGTNVNSLTNAGLPKRIAAGFKPEAVNPKDGKTYKFITIAPQAPTGSYQWTHVRYILAEMIKKYRIDESRIYITGLSYGGWGTWTCVTDNVDFVKRIAAVAPVSAMPVEATATVAGVKIPRLANIVNAATYGTAVWSICGMGDAFWAKNKSYITTINDANPVIPAKLTGIAGADHSEAVWGKVYDPSWRVDDMNLFEWFLQFSRGGTVDPPPVDPGPVTPPPVDPGPVTPPPPPPPPVNAVPVSKAGSDINVDIAVSSEAVLDGSASYDVDGNIISYKWSKIAGPATFALTDDNKVKASLANLLVGSYSFELLVTDDKNDTGKDTVNVIVVDNTPLPTTPHIPPTVNAGTDQRIVMPVINTRLTGSYTINSSLKTIKWTKRTMPGQKAFKVGWIGSSTTQGTGASNVSNSYAYLAREYWRAHGLIDSSWNLALSGTNVTQAMPTGHVPRAGWDAVDASRNITAVLDKGADVIVVNYPSNKYDVLSITDILYCYRTIYQTAVAAGKQCYITSTQPRTSFNQTVRNKLLEINDSLSLEFGDHYLDFFSPITILGTTDFRSEVATGDNIHVNNTGHRYLFEVIKAANIFQKLVSTSTQFANASQVETDITNMAPGVHQFQLSVTDNWGNAASDFVEIVVSADACGGQKRVIIPSGDKGRSISGKSFVYIPGDTLVLKAQYNPWNYFAMDSIQGTAACPVVIINEGAIVMNSIGIINGEYLKITGSGSADEYGFTIRDASGNRNGVGIDIKRKSKNIEVERVYIRDKAYGFWVKNEAATYGCFPDVMSPNWVLDSMSFHHIKIRNMESQGYYMGSTAPSGGRVATCNGVATYPIPTRLGNIKVYDNDIDSTGRSAIQLSGANVGMSEIYNNKVSNTGFQYDDAQGAGITLGGYTRAFVHHNTIRKTYRHGIWSVGSGFSRYENNNIDSSGWVGTGVLSWASSMSLETRVTTPLDSTTVWVKDNIIGRSQNPNQITFYDAYNTYGAGNIVCNNNSSGGVPATLQFSKTIKWSSNCAVVIPPPPVQVPPVAVGGPDITIELPINSITVNASASYSNGGSITGFLWTKISGPSSYQITDAAAMSTLVEDLVEGVYEFELQVTDNNGKTAKDTLKLTVLPAAVIPNVAPVAAAGADSEIVLPINSITLNGSGTDADGTISSYSWVHVSGPEGFEIATPDGPVTELKYLVEGVYEFELTVTDNKGASAKDKVIITVKPAVQAPNVLPVAYAGLDLVISLPTSSVQLIGTGTDADGTIASYLWEKISGPTAIIISEISSQTTVTDLKAGVYEFRLTVTDNKGAKVSDIVKVTVNPAPLPPNIAPKAIAGNDVVITLPVKNTTLSGSGSDIDGSISSYAWLKVSGPSTYTINNASVAVTAVNGLVEGIYEFELTVRDDDGAIGKDTVKVTVLPAVIVPNKAPSAAAGNDVSITLPVNKTVLYGSGTDTDGSIASYGWTKVSGPSSFSFINASNAVTEVNGLLQGVYEFELTVRDDDGAIAKDTVKVTVLPPVVVPNKAPTAAAGSDASITLPVNKIILNGSGTDTDGSITSYTWTKVSGPSAFSFVNASNAVTEVNGLVEGVYEFELTVRDDDGSVGKDIVKITVLPASVVPNKAPTAVAGNDASITLPVNKILLNGSGTDTDGSITGYTWTKVSGPSAFSFVNASNAITEVNGLVEGVYEFELTVRDDDGAIGKDIVKVTVLPAVVVPNIPPVANAGEDLSVYLPDNDAVLNGTASYDSDGTISFQWSKVSGPNPFTILNSNTATPTLTNLLPGTYVFELTVTDNTGAVSKDRVTLVVVPTPADNKTPVSEPGEDQVVILPRTTVIVDGSSSSDADGSVISYLWRLVSGPDGAVIAFDNLARTAITGLTEGEYEFELTVTDNKGASSSSRVKITVVNNTQRYEEEVKVYPVPTQHVLTLSVQTDDTNEVLKVNVFDTYGRILMTKQFLKDQIQITKTLDVSHLQTGTYFIQIAKKTGVTTLKFLKE